MNIRDNANIQISGDLLNLLVIRGDPDEDLASLTAALREQWQASNASRPAPGFTIPPIAQNIPAECTDEELAAAAANLQQLADDTSDALSFQTYVQGIVAEACGTAHQEALEDLNNRIIDAAADKATVLEAVYADFGNPEEQTLEIFGQFIEASYALDVNDGYTGPSPLRNDKPTVPEDCEGAVADLNAQIDATAGVLKLLEAEIDYIPKDFCAALDQEIQTTLTENENASAQPASEAILILQDLATVNQAEGQTIEEFQLQVFTEFTSGGFTEEEIDFGLPRTAYPASCSNPAAFNELAQLVADTKQAETYLTWLQGELNTACDGTQAAFAAVDAQVNNQLGFANAIKEGLVNEFFLQLGGDSDTVDDYRTQLEEAFAAAVEADEIEFPSEFSVTKPEAADLCANSVADVSAKIDADVEAVRALEDFNAFTEATVCGEIGDEVAAILAENASLVEDTGVRVIDLFNDLRLIEAEEGESAEDFVNRVAGEREADENAPVVNVDFSTPTETAPQACTDREYFSYDALNQLIADATDALSLEAYLQGRLNEACGDSASELASISSGLQAQVNAANTAKAECIAEFFGIFGGDEETLESYTADIESAFEAARDTIPARDTSELVPALPEVPETCQDFVDAAETEINARTDALVTALDCTDFFVETVCTALDQTVDQLEADNAGAVTEISGRIGLVLSDILQIEGEEGEEIPALEQRLRAEFAEETEKATFDSGITLPSETLPSKCVGYTDYSNLEDLIAFIEDTLSFEDWLKGRLQESCGTAGEEYQAVIDGLQTQIDENTAAKTALVDELFANFGGDQTREEYEQTLDDAFQAADIESTFVPAVATPSAPESCSSITNPLFLEINRKRIELIELADCIAYSTEDVCTTLGTDTDAIVAANTAQLTDKGAAVIAKLNVLRAVSDDPEEDPETFALRLRGQYDAAVAAGEFELVAADFTTPTETFPEACADYASYDALNQLIADVSDACSWDAWLQELINSKAAESIAAHNAEIERLAQLATEAEETQDELLQQLFDQFNTGDQSLEAFEDFIRMEFNELAQANALPDQPVVVETEQPAIPAGLEPLVEDLRQTISDDADALGSILDFNNFAFDFICEEAVDDIEAATVAATADLNAAAEELGGVIDDLFIVEGADGQTRLAFETVLRDEWAAADPEAGTGEPTQELPYEALPAECAAGQQKLQALREIIQDTQDIADFTEWLRPRIDDAAVIFLTCTQTKQELTDIIAEDFSQWTTCVNDKSALLQSMWDNDADVTFLDFLSETRQEYEDLKDQDMVMIIDPALEIPAVLSQCPDDVQEQLGVAESFVDILEDCGSYLAWLQAQAGGFCEVDQFDAVITDNESA